MRDREGRTERMNECVASLAIFRTNLAKFKDYMYLAIFGFYIRSN